MTKQEQLAQYSWRYEGDWARIANAIRREEPPGSETIKDRYVTIYDEAYPQSLRNLRYPPWVLFYRGNLDLLNTSCATIVGSRRMTWYGKASAELSASILSEHFTLVSGLAKGVDAIVHRVAIAKGSHTIGVIGCGLNTRYPKENEYLYKRMEEEQLILSEIFLNRLRFRRRLDYYEMFHVCPFSVYHVCVQLTIPKNNPRFLSWQVFYVIDRSGRNSSRSFRS